MPRIKIKEEDYLVNDFGKMVERERKLRDMTQEELANRLHISQPAYCNKIKNNSFSLRDIATLVVIFERVGAFKSLIQ